MRSSKSRSRGNKNRSLRPSGGNIVNRVFDSSGPDGKVRGTPAQIIEKYTQLHRDAQLSGDRVGAENFAQHAEHYTRMLAEAMREIERAREEQEQFNRERQAERDREMQREREARAERDREREAQRQAERGERDRDRDRDRDRPRQRAPEAQGDGLPPVGTGLPPFLTHGFAQGGDGFEDSGLVETPEMRDLAPTPHAPAAPDVAEAPAPRPPRARKPRPARAGKDEDGPPAAAAE